MKKMLFFLLITGIMLAACSDDDKNTAANGCLTCSITLGSTTDSNVICNEKGIAIEDGYNTGVEFEDYIENRLTAGYTCQ